LRGHAHIEEIEEFKPKRVQRAALEAPMVKHYIDGNGVPRVQGAGGLKSSQAYTPASLAFVWYCFSKSRSGKDALEKSCKSRSLYMFSSTKGIPETNNRLGFLCCPTVAIEVWKGPGIFEDQAHAQSAS